MLNDLLEIAGGLKVSAYLKRAQVDRIVPFEMRDSVGLDRKIIDIDLDACIYVIDIDNLFPKIRINPYNNIKKANSVSNNL